jgi:hypothetical protein
VRNLIDEVLALVDAPLPSVIEPQVQVRFDATVDQWDLPEPDRVALRRFGPPRLWWLCPMPQADVEPTLIPNLAGEPERRIATADQKLYLLAVFGRQDADGVAAQVGAVAGTGRVMNLRRRPITTGDIIEPLRFLYPDIYKPAVCHFNTSVTAFVETAWRWRAAGEVLRTHPEPHYLAPHEEQERYFEEIQQAREAFLDGLTALDPTLGDPNLASLWVEIIEQP